MKTAKTIPSMKLEQKTLNKNWEKYRGYIVLVVENKIFATKRTSKAKKLLEEIEKKYHKQPLTTIIPKEGTLILLT